MRIQRWTIKVSRIELWNMSAIVIKGFAIGLKDLPIGERSLLADCFFEIQMVTTRGGSFRAPLEDLGEIPVYQVSSCCVSNSLGTETNCTVKQYYVGLISGILSSLPKIPFVSIMSIKPHQYAFPYFLTRQHILVCQYRQNARIL